MEPHHKSALEEFLSIYESKAEFIGILLAGSLAHGYEQADSDIDIILIATEEEFEKRKREKALAFSIWDICKYDHGYIDCKVVSIQSISNIANRGSDPARYAFKDAQVLYSESDTIPPLLAKVCRFPIEQQADRRHRFACQLLAWKWYLSQAEKKENEYLRHLSCQKIALFASRLILNENQMLYPFHKWLLEEVKRAEKKPEGFATRLDEFLKFPQFDTAQSLTDEILSMLGLEEKSIDWPNQFMTDSELNWLDHPPPIDDL